MSNKMAETVALNKAQVDEALEILRQFCQRILIHKQEQMTGAYGSLFMRWIVAEPPTQFGEQQAISYGGWVASNSYDEACLGDILGLVQRGRALLGIPPLDCGDPTVYTVRRVESAE